VKLECSLQWQAILLDGSNSSRLVLLLLLLLLLLLPLPLLPPSAVLRLC